MLWLIIVAAVVAVWMLYKIITRGYTPKVNDEINRLLDERNGWKQIIDHIEGNERKESDEDLRT